MAKAKVGTATYTVKFIVTHDDKTYPPGEPITLTEEQAEPLVKLGSIEAAAPAVDAEQ
ncbi:hypothetical protein FHW83_004731 [Duganella sp. SG902]|uniref:DUF7210 family protein n=1 Tax=Duganella sp. SG902 TaxID=2587016 RepID=UPI00159D7EB9|nr:hypothetical protein [Duganella sp. SG902]NVM78900.1 hypothetical protein [Duganella sp. SG902]